MIAKRAVHLVRLQLRHVKGQIVMKNSFASVLIGLSFLVVTPALGADDSDSVDALLKEIRLLKQRVAQLEKQVRALSPAAEKPAVTIIKINNDDSLSRRFRRMPLPSRPASVPSVNEVMRLQFESPGTLLKGIHERERMLRKRPFFPEVTGR
jgi:hypothetical protein